LTFIQNYNHSDLIN